MTFDWALYFCLFLALWSALVGGVFKAFSEFIMAGLLRAEPAAGIESMQWINRTVLRTEFVAALISIAVFSVLFALYALFVFEGPGQVAILIAAFIYVPSVFLMTMFGNVPMNNRLAKLDHRSNEAAIYWKTYGEQWTRLNHIRTLGSIFTAGLYLVAAITLINTGLV
ncbi:MAG: DUF1772 domain-containing protein [Proteobacteria bacterium]|nr:DUF1772 domain-containing protein [Pseudomonadota bacterium]MDA0926466.1 DUF1772 domain-containing protein [Pseudomonadota bacterium]